MLFYAWCCLPAIYLFAFANKRSRGLVKLTLLLSLGVSACGGGNSNDAGNSNDGGDGNVAGNNPVVATFTIGGTVTGLTGTVVLQNNDADDLTVSVVGAFTFSTAITSGSTYAVTVLTQPIGQVCVVASGTGSATANVSDVSVTCSNVDSDLDGISDTTDNCQFIANASQVDVERDGIGDACDLTYDPVIPAPPGGEFSSAETVVIGHFLSSDQMPPFPISDTQQAFEGPPDQPGARQRLLQFSYGAADFNYVYLDWVALPQDSAFYDASLTNRWQKQKDAMQALLDLGHASTNNKYVLVFDDTTAIPNEGSPCRGGGIFPVGWPDAVGFVQLAGVGGKTCFSNYIIVHELLHSLGFSHAEGSECAGFVDGVAQNLMYPQGEESPCSGSQDLPNTIGYFYDDIMGSGLGHPSTPKKARAGWLYDSSIVRAEDDVEVVLDALEYATLGPKAVVIPISDLPDVDEPAYWVEYRADGNPTASVRIWFSGVEAMLFDGEWPYSIRDFTFSSDSYRFGLMLNDGQAFYDPYRGIEVMRISSQVDSLLPTTTVRVRRSGLRSFPRAIVVMRPGQQSVVTFENQGSVSIDMLAARVAGRDESYFTIASDGCSATTLLAGAQCSVTALSLDDDALDDIRNAVIEVTSSDALRPLANHAIRTLPLTYPDP